MEGREEGGDGTEGVRDVKEGKGDRREREGGVSKGWREERGRWKVGRKVEMGGKKGGRERGKEGREKYWRERRTEGEESFIMSN